RNCPALDGSLPARQREWSREGETCPLLCDGRRSVARRRRLAAGLDTRFLLSNQSAIRGGSWKSVLRSAQREEGVNSYRSSGAHDYRDLTERSDVLTFDSAPLERDTEVTGPIRAQIYLACDCRDTDLWVRLLDVAPDGTAFNVMGPGLDVLRASYRNLKKGRQLLAPNRVYELHLDNLITSNVFRKDHRIRVQVSAS